MKRLLPVIAIFLSIALVGDAEAQLFPRLRFHLAGPVNLPIPAFLPYFPGGTLVVQPKDGGGDNKGGSTTPATVQIDASVVNGAKALFDGMNKEDYLKKVNEASRVTNLLPKELTGRTKAIEEVKPFDASKGDAPKGGAPQPDPGIKPKNM